MRVLAVTPLYPPASRVGAWLATHGYMRHLVRRGHEVAVASYLSSRRPWTIDGIRVRTARGGKSSLLQAARGVDVVVSHYGDNGQGVQAAKLGGVPSVQLVHGWIRKRPNSADLLVCNSQATYEACGRPEGAIVCRPPTFAAEHYVEQTGDAVTIVNCADDKGIRTAGRLAEALPDLPFLGVRGDYLAQVIPRQQNFTVLPSQRDMRAVWSQTRVLLMPSKHETWGMVGVEAMTSGIPVIAHPTPGLLESLGPAGIFCDRDDLDAWVAELDRLNDPDEYATASQRARERAAALDPTPDLDAFVDALEALTA